MISRLAYALLVFPGRLRNRLYTSKLRRYCQLGNGATFTAQTVIHNPFAKDAIRVGLNTLFMGEINLISASARIQIGDWCFVGPSAKLWAMESITVGDRVFISHGVQIFDNNSHSLSADERHARFQELRAHGRHLQPEDVAHRPIVIEQDVWIGFNAAIMKGVRIGRGAVVGAGAMVTRDVGEYEVVVGNPARKVGDSRR